MPAHVPNRRQCGLRHPGYVRQIKGFSDENETDGNVRCVTLMLQETSPLITEVG